MDDYEEEFLSGEDGAAKKAVKRLTKKIELEMLKLTINAPDWYVLTEIAPCLFELTC
jgi:glycerol-3-phosphate O-acyltransferase/dihydroxyacetone phosphate acyltransferase